MSGKEIFLVLVEILGGVTGIIFYFSPVVVIYGLVSGVIDIKRVSGLSFIACFYNCVIWSADGKLSSNAISFVNYLGGLFSYIWSVIYLFYYSSENKLKRMVYIFTLTDVAIEFILFVQYSNNKDEVEYFLNYFAAIFNIFMYLSPGLNCIKIIQKKDYTLISRLSCCIGLLNCISWLLFGIFKHWKKGTSVKFLKDQLHIIIANACGAIICLWLLCTYFYLSRKYPQNKENEGNISEEGINTYFDDSSNKEEEENEKGLIGDDFF